jgi:hypothetical protein
MYVPESQFLAVIDMLRNEGPISVYYASGSGFLHTGSELIGEGMTPGARNALTWRVELSYGLVAAAMRWWLKPASEDCVSTDRAANKMCSRRRGSAQSWRSGQPGPSTP